METREMVCIVCPMGCHLTVTRGDDGQVSVAGNTCKRGETYGAQEFTNPMRVVTSSVFVDGGEMPLASVKTRGTVPKAKIGEVLGALTRVRLTAPVAIGDVVVENVVGTGVDVVATRRVDAR